MASGGAPLAGTTWQATELDGRPLPAEVRPTLELSADGRVAGSAGVNRIIGGYRLGDGVIDFGQLATTLMAGPPEAMAVERRVLDVLQGRCPYRLDGTRLELGAAAELCYEAAGDPASEATVTGALVCADAAPVPDDAMVTVQLLDVSLADAPSVTVAEQVIEHPAEGPLAFTLPYDPAAVDPRASYTVSARVTRGDELLFVSDTHNPVLTRGAPDRVDVRLRPVAPPPS
jgi:putative lipoprotein